MPLPKRTRLIRKIMRRYDAGDPHPLIDLDEFFDGNNDPGSIAPNLSPHPGTEKFWAVLRAVRDRAEVAGIVVSIHECPEEDQEADADMWPAAENVHVITRASAADVERWVSELRCTGVSDGWPYGEPERVPVMPKGYGLRTLTWD